MSVLGRDLHISDRIRRERVLVLAIAALAFAGLVVTVSFVAIVDGSFDIALLILIALGAVVLLPISPSLSFTYSCVAFPAIITLNRHTGPWGPGRLTFYFLLLLYISVAIVSWFRSPPRQTTLRAAGWLTILFVLYLLVVSLLAPDRDTALEACVNHSYHWPFLVLPTLLLRRTSHVRLIYLYLAGLGTVLAAASIFVTFMVVDPSAILSHAGRFQRVHLYFGTANTLGLFLALSLFALLYGVRFESRFMKWVKIGAEVLILIAILITFSRRTWLATGLLLFFHFLWRRDWRGVVVVALVAAALGYQMRGQIGERAESMVEMEHSSNIGRQREITERLDYLFGDGLSATGWGMDMSVAASEADLSRALYFHNYYLTLYYLSGAIGLGLFLLIMGAVIRGLRRVQLLARGPTPRQAAAVGLSALIIVMLTGLFGNANITFPVNYFSSLLPGLAFAALALERQEDA